MNSTQTIKRFFTSIAAGIGVPRCHGATILLLAALFVGENSHTKQIKPPNEQVIASGSDNATANFRVFNSMLFEDMPAFGERLGIVGERSFFGDDRHGRDLLPTAAGFEAAALAANALYDEPFNATAEFVVLDVERWPTWPFATGKDQRTSIDRYLTTALGFARASEKPFCYYAVVPSSGPVQAVWAETRPAVRQEWNEATEVAAALVPHMHALCPSIYTHYGALDADQRQGDIERWRIFARETIAQARKVADSKPVYPFIWPRYHAGGNRKGQPFVEPDFWRAQLELMIELADGVIVWGGFGETWDDNAPWWKILRETTNVKVFQGKAKIDR